MDMLLHFTSINDLHPDLREALTKVTKENIDDIFNTKYLKQMIPELVTETQDLFNEISRVHQLKKLKCYKQIEKYNHYQ